jgi:hypothetical protein
MGHPPAPWRLHGELILVRVGLAGDGMRLFMP